MLKAKRIFEKSCSIIVIVGLFSLFFMKTGANKVFQSYWKIIYQFFTNLVILTKGLGFWNIIFFILILLVALKLINWVIFDSPETEWEKEDKKERAEIKKSLQQE
jgi:Na+-transporting methylmalonyl-CoA/oxaloacetate decarboxylase gamma subunit